jgi:hypothetical protein
VDSHPWVASCTRGICQAAPGGPAGHGAWRRAVAHPPLLGTGWAPCFVAHSTAACTCAAVSGNTTAAGVLGSITRRPLAYSS